MQAITEIKPVAARSVTVGRRKRQLGRLLGRREVTEHDMTGFEEFENDRLHGLNREIELIWPCQGQYSFQHRNG